MKASVIVRSRNEADRLRLTLTSLACQSEGAQVVVVNDGSTDHTADVIGAAAGEMDIVAIHHTRAAGRSAAANAGAAAASGDILIFLDGDTLAGPDLVAAHLRVHGQQAGVVARGENYHLRCTRPFHDPQTGTPQPGEEERVARMAPGELARAVVTRQQIMEDFAGIDRRAQPGVYPGYGPRRLYELEMDALRHEADCDVLWAAAAGANQSVPRQAFVDSGGFHPDISINEHRELALRLCQAGLRMVACTARSYHLIHRSGWRDPLEDQDWEGVFYQAHPRVDVALLPILWRSLSDTQGVHEHARILSLPQLSAIATRYRTLDTPDAVRDAYLAAVNVPPSPIMDEGLPR